MLTELLRGVPAGDGYTYGAALVELDETGLDGNGPAFGHGGDITGYHSMAMYFPTHKVTIALVIHNDRGPTSSFPFGATYLGDMYANLVRSYFAAKTQPSTFTVDARQSSDFLRQPW